MNHQHAFPLRPQLNRAEFQDVDDETRVQYEGFRPGMYVRLEIPSLPCEFVTNFDPHYPIILGGLGSSEGNVGYLQVGCVQVESEPVQMAMCVHHMREKRCWIMR